MCTWNSVAKAVTYRGEGYPGLSGRTQRKHKVLTSERRREERGDHRNGYKRSMWPATNQ